MQHGRQHKRWVDEVSTCLRQRRPDLHRPTAHTCATGEPNDITCIQTVQDTETWTAFEHHYVDPTPADTQNRSQ
eukprot:8077624-Pyramimonas_sp.AAC.1